MNIKKFLKWIVGKVINGNLIIWALLIPISAFVLANIGKFVAYKVGIPNNNTTLSNDFFMPAITSLKFWVLIAVASAEGITVGVMLKRRSTEKISENSLLRLFGEKESRRYSMGAIFISLSVLTEMVLVLFSLNSFNIWLFAFLLLLILLCIVKMWIMSYRIKHGFLGTCAEEARELIYFVLENQDESGKSNGMKLKFPKEELEELVVKEPAGGEVHV